jgi:hypothetical protein
VNSVSTTIHSALSYRLVLTLMRHRTAAIDRAGVAVVTFAVDATAGHDVRMVTAVSGLVAEVTRAPFTVIAIPPVNTTGWTP